MGGHLAIISDDKYSEGPLGRIVFASGVAPHGLESLCVTFAPTRDQTYHLWYVVGGAQVSLQRECLPPVGCFTTIDITEAWLPWSDGNTHRKHESSARTR